MIGGHGHVIPRADGARARCGGPAICTDCAKEQAELGARRLDSFESWLDELEDCVTVHGLNKTKARVVLRAFASDVLTRTGAQS